jgi:hypothetical protein
LITRLPIQIAGFYRDNRRDGVSLTLNTFTFGPEAWPGVADAIMSALSDSIAWHYQQPSLSDALRDTENQLRAHIPRYNLFVYGSEKRPLNHPTIQRRYSDGDMRTILSFAVVFFTNIYALEQFGVLKPDNWNGMSFAYMDR